MSLFLQKSDQSTTQPWTYIWTPGINLANFFALYDSLGTKDRAAYSVSTTLDGPIQVERYGALTVSGLMTASQRCRGLIVLADSLSVGASGVISMTARGARGAVNWAVGRDIFVPASITFTGQNTSLAQFLAWIRRTGYCIFDPSMYACPPPGMGDVTCNWATWTPYGQTLIKSEVGNGLGAAGNGAFNTATGATGGTGSNGPGGGGGGGAMTTYVTSMPGGPGNPWGGGAAGGGSNALDVKLPGKVVDQYGGKGGDADHTGGNSGGGAGNPGGIGYGTGSAGSSGTGGVLFVFVAGGVTLSGGTPFESKGSQGGAAGATVSSSGSGSGGGKIAVIHKNAMTGTFTTSVAGGLAGTGGSNGVYTGGPGGAGHAEEKPFSTMGWDV